MNVGQLNQTLADKLQLLRGATDREAAVSINEELNEILYSAMRNHAPSVHAVQIQTRKDTSVAMGVLVMGGMDRG